MTFALRRKGPMLHRPPCACLRRLAALAFALAAIAVHAQAHDALPPASAPPSQPASQYSEAASALPLPDPQHGGNPLHGGCPEPPCAPVPAVSNTPEAEAPILSMAPHHGADRWWLSGQANVIFQGDLPFHSPYEGTNSFRIQDLAAGNTLRRAPAHPLDPLLDRPDSGLGEFRWARSQPGSRTGQF